MNLDALLKPIEPNAGTPCKIKRIMDTLEDPYKTALKNIVEKSVDDGGLSPNQAGARIREAGIEISSHSIYRHRIGSCACRGVNND